MCYTVSCPCRKRRLYAQQEITELLQAEGYSIGTTEDSCFPLDIFDNTDYESRLPEEWVPKARGQ